MMSTPPAPETAALPEHPIRLYNTATRRKETFVPQDAAGRRVLMYNCGPTVYDYFHIGNARNFVVMDAIRRHLTYRGYQVRFAQNFTDIDDKIIKRAAEAGEPWQQLAERFTRAYERNAAALGVLPADIHPKATEHVPQMLDLIKELEQRGLAYGAGEGDVYFRVRRFQQYGALSGRNVDDMREGARVEIGEKKEDPLDFALWKGVKLGEPSWESPWGAGRPGWHLECSAMVREHLGETIDIHSGGADLCFPHHENECAQSTGATGKPLARYWLHNGFLTINQEKMSKSLGNFFTIDQVLEKFSAATVRFYLLGAHYRHPLDYSDKALEEARSALGRIREAVLTAEKLAKLGGGGAEAATASEKVRGAVERFDAALDDDFNTQQAIGVLFELVSHLNEQRKAMAVAATAGTAVAEVLATLTLLHGLLGRLGLDALLFNGAADPAVAPGAGAGQEAEAGAAAVAADSLTDALMGLLIEVRGEAKKAKQFALADLIRTRLGEHGIKLQDHPQGTIWARE